MNSGLWRRLPFEAVALEIRVGQVLSSLSSSGIADSEYCSFQCDQHDHHSGASCQPAPYSFSRRIAREVTTRIVALRPGGRVIERDLAADPPPHPDLMLYEAILSPTPFCSLIKRLNGGFLAKGSHFAWLIEA
jgi:hypothetical protein